MNDKKWGLLFILDGSETEERFKECAKLSGLKYHKEKNNRDKLAYSIVRCFGKNHEEKFNSFKKFLRYLNECCNYHHTKRQEMIIVKVESI